MIYQDRRQNKTADKLYPDILTEAIIFSCVGPMVVIKVLDSIFYALLDIKLYRT